MSLGWCKRGLAVFLLGCSARFVPAQGFGPNPQQDQDSSQSQPVAQTDQSGQSDTPATQGQADDSATYDARRDSRAPVPLPLNIDAGSLKFADGQEQQNYLFGGIGASATYDDNLLSQSALRIGGFSYSVFPTVGVDISRRRLALNMDYEGGYTFNQRFSAYNQSEHNADFDLRYRVSPHVNLRLHNHFLLTTGFLDQLSGGLSGIGAGTGIIQQPNLGVITPIAPHTFDLGSVELTYQYSASDMVGGSGNVYISSFGTPPTGAQNLVDSRSEGGNAFYTHRFTPRNWSGIAYSFQRLTFDPIMEDVNTHDILLFHTIYLNQHTALAFFAGPEYSQLDSVIVTTHVAIPLVTVTSTTDTQDRWGVAGGASLSWQGKHTSVSAGGSRKVSDGGGLLTAADVTSGTGAVRRQISRNSTIELDVIYTGSHALGNGGTTFFSNSKAAWGNFLWEQHISKNLMCTLGYARDYLQQSGTALPTLGVNHNRGWVSVVYRFSRPLGR